MHTWICGNKSNGHELKILIMDADVVIDGYCPDVLKKWGFEKDEILDLVKGREKGIIYAYENCYVSVIVVSSVSVCYVDYD